MVVVLPCTTDSFAAGQGNSAFFFKAEGSSAYSQKSANGQPSD